MDARHALLGRLFDHEEEALRAPAGSLLHSIGSCSFFEPVGELHDLGIL